MNQTINQLELDAAEILASKKWENASEHLSDMNKRLIQNVASGKTAELSDVMLDYAPHAIEQGRQALTKAKRDKKK